MRIAISGMGSVTSQSLVRSIRASDPSAWILGLDANPWAVGLYQCDEQALVPPASSPAFIPGLQQHLASNQIDLYIPGVDPELMPVARHREELESTGAKVVVASPEVVGLCRDKERGSRELRAAGLPFVRTWPLDGFRTNGPADAWPVVVKPRGGSGSRGVQIAFRSAELPPKPLSEDYIVQEYLVPKSWGVGHRSEITPDHVLRQGRFWHVDEIGVQGVVGPDGTVVGLSACWNEQLNGIPTRSYCFTDPELTASATAILEFLSRLGLRGTCNLQGRITDRGFVLYEINPRFGANTGVRSLLGFNEYLAIVDLFVKGLPLEQAKLHLNPDESKICFRILTEETIPWEAVEHVTGTRHRGTK